MKNVAIFILWGILVLFLISFSATILETVLSVKVDYYSMNLLCILALVALHYFKFRKSWTEQQETISSANANSSKVWIKGCNINFHSDPSRLSGRLGFFLAFTSLSPWFPHRSSAKMTISLRRMDTPWVLPSSEKGKFISTLWTQLPIFWNIVSDAKRITIWKFY